MFNLKIRKEKKFIFEFYLKLSEGVRIRYMSFLYNIDKNFRFKVKDCLFSKFRNY